MGQGCFIGIPNREYIEVNDHQISREITIHAHASSTETGKKTTRFQILIHGLHVSNTITVLLHNIV